MAEDTGSPRHAFRVKGTRRLGEQVVLLKLEAPPSFRQQAGQWVKLSFPREGDELTRIYSMASPPSELPEVTICIRLFEDSEGTEAVSGLKEGDPVFVDGPHGKFLLEAESGDPMLFVSTSVAIAPMRALLLEAEAQGHLRSKALLFHATRGEGVLPFQDDMERLAGRTRGFDYHMTLLEEEADEADPSSWATLRAQAYTWAEELKDRSQLKVFLSGHGGMIKPLRAQLSERLGLEASQIKAEQFWK